MMRGRGDDFDPAIDIPDLSGRVAIVTGANTGIGYETAKLLAARGAKVYLACRNPAKARKAIEDMTRDLRLPDKSEKGRRPLPMLEWLCLDLATVGTATEAAQEFLRREQRLDILINNAGVLSLKYELNQDGVESTMATNHIGHFAFTTMLLPILTRTARLLFADVRIVTVTSELHTYLSAQTRLHTLADLNATMEGLCTCPDSTVARFWRYCLSKLANILFTRALQRRLDSQGLQTPIIATCVHPGMVTSSNMLSHVPSALRPLLPLFTLSPSRGAYTALFAATSPTVRLAPADYKGKYLIPFGKVGKVGKAVEGDSRRSENGEELWKVSEDIVRRATLNGKA